VCLIRIVRSQDLDRHLATEVEIFRREYHSHPTFAELVEDAVMGDDRVIHGFVNRGGRLSAPVAPFYQERSPGARRGTMAIARFRGA
jgi:hypothetical protein